MKKNKIIVMIILILFTVFVSPQIFAGLGDFFNKVKKAVGGEAGLSEEKIIKGLKEALQIGTKNSVDFVSVLNGYYENPKIKIPLPESVQKVEKALRKVGYGSKIDEFELSMNRAAEKAAPQAKAIFLDTIKAMNFQDAKKILNGKENEATLYFKEKTSDKLTKLFKPVIQDGMSKVDATSKYQALEKIVGSIPFVNMSKMNLDQYVTGRSLDGLFFMLAEEEKKIRSDPAARVTDLLKQVFKKD